MKYLAVDIETTGLLPIVNSILEVVMVADINEVIAPGCLPSLRFLFKKDSYFVQPYAASLHQRLWTEIANDAVTPGTIVVKEVKEMWPHVDKFVEQNFEGQKRITIAGKNFGNFDAQFLKPLPKYFTHRFLDPAIMFLDPDKDYAIPDMTECCKRAVTTPTDLHTAYGDCIDIIKLTRCAFKKIRAINNGS